MSSRLLHCICLAVAIVLASASSAEAGELPDPRPALVPSLGIGVGTPITEEDSSSPYEADYLPLWIGSTFYPSPSAISGFVAVGAQVHVYFTRDDVHATTPELIPTLRGGVAALAAPNNVVGQLFAMAKIYGLAGYRIPGDRRDGAFQVGLGVSSPLLMLASLAAAGKLFIPTALELSVGVTMRGAVDSFDFRYGVEF